MSEFMSAKGGDVEATPRIAVEAVTLTNGVKIYQVWEAIKDLVEEANVVFTKKGILVNSFDINDIALINLTLLAKSFQRYVCHQNHVLGLNILQLYKAFKMCTKDSCVTMRIMSNDPGTVLLMIANATTGWNAEIKLMSVKIEKKMMTISNSIFTQYMTMPSSEFHALIGFIGNFNATSEEETTKVLLIEVFDDNSMAFSNRGDTGSLRMIVKPTNSSMHIKHGNFNAIESDEVLVKRVSASDEDALKNAENAAEATAAAAADTKKKRKLSEKAVASTASSEADPKTLNEAQENFASTTKLVARAPAKCLVKTPYILSYVKKFTRALSLSPQVMLFVKQDYPLILTYVIGNLGILHFCLGPTQAKESGSDAAASAAESRADRHDNENDSEGTENMEE